MPPGPPKPPGIKLPSSPLGALRDIISKGCEQIEKAGSDIRSLADELHSGFPSTITTTTLRDSEKAPEIEPQSRRPGSRVSIEGTGPQQEAIATACVACAVGHFSTSSGLLKEAVRFKGEGMTSNEILDRIAGALEEQNALEREDLSPEKIQRLPEWEKAIAEEALDQSRQLRHRLESIQSVDELEQAAVDTKRYYIKLNRQWYKGRFGYLGAKKAETIAQRVGEK